ALIVGTQHRQGRHESHSHQWQDRKEHRDDRPNGDTEQQRLPRDSEPHFKRDDIPNKKWNHLLNTQSQQGTKNTSDDPEDKYLYEKDIERLPSAGSDTAQHRHLFALLSRIDMHGTCHTHGAQNDSHKCEERKKAV